MPDYSERIRQLTPEQREMLLRRCSPLGKSPARPIPRRRDLEDAPLSFAQQRLWFLEQLAPHSGAYLIPLLLNLHGRLNATVLQDSLRAVVQRHDVLRASFPTTPQGPRQRVAPHADCHLPIESFAPHSPSSQDSELASAVRQELQHPFILEHGPLLRTRLWQLDHDTHALLLLLHHIIADGWSLGILLHELATFYTAQSLGITPTLEPLSLQYPDYAAWQQDSWSSTTSHPAWPYWKEKLADLPRLNLPHDRPRLATPYHSGASKQLFLPAAMSHSIIAACRQYNITLFSYLLALFQVLLEQFSGQNDIAVATPVAGRNHLQLEPLIGCFVNTLVIRGRVRNECSFREHLTRTHDDSLGAFAHQELPFEKLVEELRPIRDAASVPLAQVLFAVQNTPPRACDFLGIQPSVVELEVPTARFDLEFNVWETPQGIRLILTCNSSLFEPSTVEQLLLHFRRLLEQVTATPNVRLSALPHLSSPIALAPAPLRGQDERSGVVAMPSSANSASSPGLMPRDPLFPQYSLAELETLIASSWQDVLATPCTSPNDDFFDLGGNSLTAARATRWLSDYLGVPLDVRGLFETRTVQRFARYADAFCWVQRTNPVHPDDEELAF